MIAVLCGALALLVGGLLARQCKLERLAEGRARLIAQQQSDLEAERKRLLESNESLRSLSARMIEAKEEERKSLARELHDNLCQQVAAVSTATDALKKQIPEVHREAREQSDRIHRKLVEIAEDVRRISHELHPAALQYADLATALRSHCAEFGAFTGVRVALEIEGVLEGVAPGISLCLFRIAQEALRNVAKHAGVAEASVNLRRHGGMLRLIVSDSGIGMDAGAAKGGLGLLNIQERARMFGGKAEIRSRPQEGTTIFVEVPE